MSDPYKRNDDDLAYGGDYSGGDRGYYDGQGGQGGQDRGIIGDTFKKLKAKYDQRQGQGPPQDYGYGAQSSAASSTYNPPGSSGYSGGGGYTGTQPYQQQYQQPQGQSYNQPGYSGSSAQQTYQSQGQGNRKPDLADKLIGGLFGSIESVVGDVQNIAGHRPKPQGQGQYGQQYPGATQPGLQSNLQSRPPTQHGRNRYESTFPGPKPGNDVKWYVDGASYMWAVSEALENARQSIWILDWWLSPELYLRRPPARNEEWRVDRILARAAGRGVKVNIIVYKEVTQALTLSSAHTKHALEALSPNIGVFRHPDHLPDAQTAHSSLTSALQGLKLDAAGVSKLGADALKGVYGISDDVILYWAHHEKLCIVDGNIAFMGGLDLCYGRWDTHQHAIADAHPSDLNKIVFPGQDFNNARVMDFSEVDHPFQNKLDRTKSSRMGWSDISICLHGPCVGDLIHHFVDRWNFIYDEKYNVRQDKRYQRLPPYPDHHDQETPAAATSTQQQSGSSLSQGQPGVQQGQFAPPPQAGNYQQPAWQGSSASQPAVGAGLSTYTPRPEGSYGQTGNTQQGQQAQQVQQQSFPPPPPGPPSATSQYGPTQQQGSFPPPPGSQSSQQPYTDTQHPSYTQSQQPQYGSSQIPQQQSSYSQPTTAGPNQQAQSSYGTQDQPSYSQKTENPTTQQGGYSQQPQQYSGQQQQQSSYNQPGSTVPAQSGGFASSQQPQNPSSQYTQPSPLSPQQQYSQTPPPSTFSPPPQSGPAAYGALATHAPPPHDYTQRPTTPQQQQQQAQSPQQQQQQVQQQYAAYAPPQNTASELPTQSSPGYQPYNPQGSARGFEEGEYSQGHEGSRGFDDSSYEQGYSGQRGLESGYDQSYGQEHEYGQERAFGFGGGKKPGNKPQQGPPGQQSSRFDKYKDQALQYGNQLESRYRPRVEGEINKFTGGKYGRPSSRAGGMSCQLVRSCTKWSNGTNTEHSVQNAYIDLIQHAQHFIYIENQFFITATGDQQGPVKNQIGKALVERILRAARVNQPFKVIVNIPAIPAFAGDLVDDQSLGTRAIMEFQYNSICRGGHSIMEEIQRAGFNPLDYIRFYNLRSYDRINVTPAMTQAQQQTGVGYDDARRQYESQLGSGYGGYGETSGQTQTYASQQGEYQYQQAAQQAPHTAADQWDTVSSCYMLNGQDIRTVPWTGPPEAEIDAFVSEELYIHSKIMIVDDQTVICGSANLNDRSMLGLHDSEIALVINDSTPVQSTMAGRPWQASKFAVSLRRQLFRKHLGLIPGQDAQRPTNNFLPVGTPNDYDWGSPEDNVVTDPLSDTFQSLWNTRARTNTDIFRKAFRAVPDDHVPSWAEYKEFYEYYFSKADAQAGGRDQYNRPSRVEYGHVVREDFPGGAQELKQLLSQIKGTLVEMPLCFLQNEDIAKEGVTFNPLTAEIYT